MPARAALAALVVSLLWPLPAAASDASPSSEPAPQPAAFDRSADCHATVRSMRTMMQSVPDSAVRTQVLPVLEDIDRRAAELPPEKREAFIIQNMPELTAVTAGLSPDGTPKPVLRDVQNYTAYLNNRASRWEEGRRFSDKVLAFDPDDRNALLNRSNSNWGLRNFKSAFEDADQAAKLSGNDADAYAARALASYELGEYLSAMEDSRRALALSPNNKTAYTIMQLSEGKVPRTPISGEQTAREFAVQSEYHGMVTQITQAVAKSQELPLMPASKAVNTRLQNAARAIALKDYYGAVAEAEKVLADDPNNVSAHYYRAAAFNLIGKYDNAAAAASQALTIDPADFASRDARAYAYIRQGRYKDAIADCNHALELNPKDPYAYYHLGFVNEKMGKLEDMMANLKRASDLSPQFEPVYRDAASAYGLDLPASAKQPKPAEPAPAPIAPKQKQFLFILVSSVLGGILIALGLLHVFGPQLARRQQAPQPLGRQSAPREVPNLRAKSAIDDAYAIGKPLGHGGMGVVYAALDKALGRRVAIKMLLDDYLSDPKAKEQFLDEARTVAALHHPHIVDIHSIVSDEKGLYLVFEFIEGETMEGLIARKGRLPLAEAKAIMKPVCAALDFAHRHHVVHRDLKPANIMLTDQGVIKVMDFGISRRIKDVLTAVPGGGRSFEVTDSVVGTPYYMAPEQEYGIVRPESDIYSLGTCLYEMVTGKRPYPAPANHAQKMSGQFAKPSVLEASLPRSFDVLMDGALHPDPDKRIRSAADFWSMLDAVRETDAGILPS